MLPAAPLVSVVTIVLICASIIGTSAEQVKNSGGLLLLAVFLLHAFGFFLVTCSLACSEIPAASIQCRLERARGALYV